MAFDTEKFIGECKKAIGQASDFCVNTAQAAAKCTTSFFGPTASRAKQAANTAKNAVKKTADSLVQASRAFFEKAAAPFVKMAHAPGQMLAVYHEKGTADAASYLFCGIRNNRNFFTTIANYTAPVLGVLILCSVIHSANNVHYALEVTRDGEHIGYVDDESVLTAAQENLRQRIIYTDGTQASFEMNPTLSIVPVNSALVSDADTMTNTLIRMSSEDVSEAHGLYVDGEFRGAVVNVKNVEQILKDALDQYRTGAEGEEVAFVKNIEIRDGLFLTSSLVKDEEMEEYLHSSEQAERTYTIEKGDSPIQIAQKNGIPYRTLKALNPEIEKVCKIGQKALIATEKPLLSVRVLRNEKTVETIKHEVETEKDNNQYVGYEKTVQEGEDGSREITASVEYVDGHETSRTVLNTVVLKEPVTEKIVKGTKQKINYSSGRVLSGSSGSGTYSGNFRWPVSTGGYISCGYSSGHRAIDIPCPYGTAIVAASGGRVIRAGWDSSYGKVVIVDHGNGLQTLYAHNSALNVAVGDQVSQGQTIAQAGNTGFSFGNHCHFEVRVNGQRVNPRNYVGR